MNYLKLGTGYPWAGQAITTLVNAAFDFQPPLNSPVTAGALLPTGSTTKNEAMRAVSVLIVTWTNFSSYFIASAIIHRKKVAPLVYDWLEGYLKDGTG